MTDRKPDENLMNSPVWEPINRTLHILMFFRMTCLFSMDFTTKYMLALWFRLNTQLSTVDRGFVVS